MPAPVLPERPSLPPSSPSLSLSAALGHALTDKRIDILRHIGECGSISQAARAAGVSYKAAWQAVDTLTNLAGALLVTRAVGGAGGGGAQLTEAGRQLLQAAGAMEQARGEVLSRWQATPHAGPALARLSVRTSMRNQWPCVVQRLEWLGPIVRVHLAVEVVGSATAAAPASAANAASSVPLLLLAARITRESAELLGLQPGMPVQALCKATAVRVARKGIAKAPVGEGSAPAGIFRLPARATRVVRGPAGDEVAATLAGGVHGVGFAAAGSGVRVGSAVVLEVEDNAVVLAVGEG